jgi:HK97 family phage major capsid protein
MPAFLALRYARFDRKQLDGHLLTGTGSKQPLGILPFMNDVNSARQVTGVTGGSIVGALTFGDLIDLEMMLAEEYRANAVFIASPTAIKELKKLEDTAGSAVWQRAREAGQPSTLLGYKIIESVSMEAGTSTGEQPVIFADMSMYLLAEEVSHNMEVLDTYRASNQIGLKFGRAYDGMPLDKLAFASIKIQA